MTPTTVSPRPGKQLFDATMPFAEESPARSWWNVGSTLAILLALLVCAAVAPRWPLRQVGSISSGLVMVRTFILYYDYMHGSLLSESRLAAQAQNSPTAISRNRIDHRGRQKLGLVPLLFPDQKCLKLTVVWRMRIPASPGDGNYL